MRLSAVHRRFPRLRRSRGFTLIELMVTITLLAILLGLAAPSLRTWTFNGRVRTTSESLQNGVRLAQAEAVRQNRQVVLLLTNAEPSATAASVANGQNWAIRTVPFVAGEAVRFVRGGALRDVAGGVAITGPRELCFGPSGRVITPAGQNCAAPVVNFDVEHANANRRLRVLVALGGQVRMCDIDKAFDAANPDGCP